MRKDKKKIIQSIVKTLEKGPALFAYLYGSFLHGNKFHDVDTGVFFDEKTLPTEEEIFDYALKW